MRDNWNHPSVAIWDASNETHWSFLRQKLVPSVRGLDLSNRPWENGYEQPAAPGDPYEDHPYLFISYLFGKPPYFQLADLEKRVRPKLQDWQAHHAAIINEYDWLWLHRDGTPTELTRKVYDSVLGPAATPAQRRAFHAYALAGITEYWRARREYAGVLYLAYLDGDLPHAFTCDNFRDVAHLQLDPDFEDYLAQAFKPLGVCLEFWQASLPAAIKRTYRVTLINDTHQTAAGRLTLAWEPGQNGAAETRFTVPPGGTAVCDLELPAPAGPGEHVLTARAFWDDKPWSPVLSRRKVTIKATNVGP